ncbi:MAG: hypothetical protein AB7O21_03480 [Gammaproteobacteria bacterium]
MFPKRYAVSLSRVAAWLLLACACAVPAADVVLRNVAPAELAGEILDPVDDREVRRQRAQAPRPHRAEILEVFCRGRFEPVPSLGDRFARCAMPPRAPPESAPPLIRAPPALFPA